MFLLATTYIGKIFINLDNVTMLSPGRDNGTRIDFISSEDYTEVRESFEEMVNIVTTMKKRG